MEIVNSTLIKKFVLIVCLATLLLTTVPLLLYIIKFDANLSEIHADWAAFGDFVGGIIGTLFSLVAAVFSLFSIYITLRIATQIHLNEQKFNAENIEREKERFEREIELVHKQNKPYPTLNFNKYPYKSDVTLENQGPGTLIITKVEINYGGNVYTDFGILLKTTITELKFLEVFYMYNPSYKHVVNSGGQKFLFELNAEDKNQTINEKLFYEFNSRCVDIISKAKVVLYYEDIFENQYFVEEDLEL
jgi:hypothetical protein